MAPLFIDIQKNYFWQLIFSANIFAKCHIIIFNNRFMSKIISS